MSRKANLSTQKINILVLAWDWQGWGNSGEWKVSANRYSVYFYRDKNIFILIVMMVAQPFYTKNIELYNLSELCGT